MHAVGCNGQRCTLVDYPKIVNNMYNKINRRDNIFSCTIRPKSAFTLTKLGYSFTLEAMSDDENLDWLQALKPFVVKDDIYSNYTFSHLIG